MGEDTFVESVCAVGDGCVPVDVPVPELVDDGLFETVEPPETLPSIIKSPE